MSTLLSILYEPVRDHYFGRLAAPVSEIDKGVAKTHKSKMGRKAREQKTVASFGYIDGMFPVRDYKNELTIEDKAALL